MIKLAIAILILFFSENIIAEDPFTSGKKAYEAGKYNEAINLFKDAIRKNKRNIEAFIWLSKTYIKVDSLAQAEATLVQAREHEPKNPNIYDLLGDVYLSQKIPAAAIEQYKKAVELDTTNVALYLKLGEVSRKSRQYEEAVKAYINVLLLDTANVTALRELAVIYMRAKQYQKALPLFRDLVKVEPDSISYKMNYVKVLYETKYFKELIPFAEEILKQDSTQIEIQNILRDAYVEIKDYPKAEKLFALTIIDSLTNEDLIKRGKALKALEKYDEAILSFELAYQRDTTLQDVFYDLATLYNKKERYAEAVRMFDKKIEADTSSNYRWACYFQAAQSLANMKDYKKAKEYILKSLEYKPDYINAWDMLAQYNGALGLENEQSIALRKVIDLITKAEANGNGGDNKYKNILDAAYRTLGYQLYNSKKYSESIEYYKKAFQLSPTDCALALTIGQIYHRNKNEAEAKVYYCKVLQLCPKSEHAKSATTGLKLMGEDCGQ